MFFGGFPVFESDLHRSCVLAVPTSSPSKTIDIGRKLAGYIVAVLLKEMKLEMLSGAMPTCQLV
jgi:hypothetical protein